MCLLSFAIDTHPRYHLVLAANRDEFFHRSAAPARFWDDVPRILAGRDLEAGGTWLGVSASGRLAALTNFYGPNERALGKPSRGTLVTDFLKGDLAAEEYFGHLQRTGDRYNGFGLIFGDMSGLSYYTNRGPSVHGIPAGVHGLSNHLLDTHWPKVVSIKAGFQRVIETSDIIDPEDLFSLLSNRTRYPDHLLPHTGGANIELERSLSSIFVSRDGYGTRCSTIILIGRDNRMTFLERSYDENGNRTGTVEYCLNI